MPSQLAALLQQRAGLASDEALSRPYFGNPNILAQALRAGVGRRSDMLSGPATAFAGGLLGTAPDEQGGSVMDPNSARNSPNAAMAGFGLGTALQATPFVNALQKLLLPGRATFGKISPGLATPSAPQRAFNLDYPKSIEQPLGSPLISSIEGAPLTAPVIAGRRTVGGIDEALPWGTSNDAAGLLGANPAAVSAKELGKNKAGEFRPMFNDDGRFQGPRKIEYLNTLGPRDANQVIGHELGHLIEDIAAGNAGFSGKGTAKELDTLYDALNKKLNGSKTWTPADDGYKGVDVAREKWAEALRAYQEDPNFIKSFAPNVAKVIRQNVNTHPEVSKVIQFNSAAGGGAVAASDSPDLRSWIDSMRQQ